MSGEETFLANRAEIERAVRFVAGRARLSPQDAEELQSQVNIRLIENDYAVVRHFKGGCAFSTYVHTIARHVLADQRMHELGRYRPSARAKRLGEPGMRLEELLSRDKKTFDEAFEILQRHHTVTREEAEAMAASLRPRMPRLQVQQLDDNIEPAVGPDTVEKRAIEHERDARAALIRRVYQETLSTFSEADQLVFRLRWGFPPVTVARISRMLHRDQNKLYPLLDRMLKRLGEAFRSAGVTAAEIRDLTDGSGCSLDFSLDNSKNEPACQPIDPKGSGNDEVLE